MYGLFAAFGRAARQLTQDRALAAIATVAPAEVDFYTDWKLNRNFTASIVLAFANPGSAVEQATGRTASFRYGMAYLGYSF